MPNVLYVTAMQSMLRLAFQLRFGRKDDLPSHPSTRGQGVKDDRHSEIESWAATRHQPESHQRTRHGDDGAVGVGLALPVGADDGIGVPIGVGDGLRLGD